MKLSLTKIFLKFFKIGIMLLGGGYAMLPVLKSELVEKSEVLSEEELVDYYALAQSIPGVIACNLAIFIGYKLRRSLGAIVAGLGVVVSAFLPILIIAIFLKQFAEIGIIKSIFFGVGVGVIVLIITAILDIWKYAILDKWTILITLVTLILSIQFNVSPAYIILSALIVGVLLARIKTVKK